MTKKDDEANEAYNEKVLASGAWIDKEFLQDALSSALDDEVNLVSHNVSAAVGAGDNFLSILYKTAVQFTTSGNPEPQERHLMIKGVPTAKVLLEMIEDMGVFRKEITMYGKCLPAMQRFLKEYFPEGSQFVAPDSYKCSRENTLIMEDLGASGYKMANRREQLDLDHCHATLRTLARFHALSVKVYENDPQLIQSVSEEFYTEANREKMAQFLGVTFQCLSTATEKWAEYSRFSPLIKDVGASIWENLIRMTKPSKSLNVLNHGDMWVNNMMYKYNDDGTVENAKLVDFQLSRYCTPALDLHYFLFTSLQPSVLTEHMESLLEVYHEALIADLATLGVEVDYSVEQLQEDMRDRAAFGLLSLTQILPIIVADPSDSFDMDNFKPEEAESLDFDHPLMVNYKNPHYQKVAGIYLTKMESIGYLDDIRERMPPVYDAAVVSKAPREEGEGAEE